MVLEMYLEKVLIKETSPLKWVASAKLKRTFYFEI